MLASSTISNEQKVLWLMQWNESNVLREAKFQNKVFLTLRLIGGLTRPPFGLKYPFYRSCILLITKFLPNFKDL
jgi:hypothetical protein